MINELDLIRHRANHMGGVMNAQVLVIQQETNVSPETHSAAAASGTDAAALIKTRAAEFVEQRLNHFQDNVDDFLFELAGKTQDEDLNYLYLDTISRLRNKRDILKKIFLANVEQLCQDSNSPLSAVAIVFTADSAAIDKLLLGGNDDLEAMIAMKNIAETYQRRYASELSALHAAVATQRQVLAALTPLLLCIAWKQATDTLKLSVKARFVIYKVFSKFVLDDLATVYQGLLGQISNHVPPAEPAPIVLEEKKNEPVEIADSSTTNTTLAAVRNISSDSPIEKKLHGRKLPDTMHQFLFTTWSEVLVQVKAQKGIDSPAWIGAMQVIDDLAIVSQSKQIPQNHARLLEIIPRLLCNLQNGLSLITYEKQKKEQLFNQLLTLHAHAIQSRKGAR